MESRKRSVIVLGVILGGLGVLLMLARGLGVGGRNFTNRYEPYVIATTFTMSALSLMGVMLLLMRGQEPQRDESGSPEGDSPVDALAQEPSDEA